MMWSLIGNNRQGDFVQTLTVAFTPHFKQLQHYERTFRRICGATHYARLFFHSRKKTREAEKRRRFRNALNPTVTGAPTTGVFYKLPTIRNTSSPDFTITGAMDQ